MISYALQPKKSLLSSKITCIKAWKVIQLVVYKKAKKKRKDIESCFRELMDGVNERKPICNVHF